MIDFGVSKKIEDQANTFSLLGTDVYKSPEMLKGSGYNKSTDWWGLGIFLYELINCVTPFEEENGDEKQLYQNIVNKELEFPEYCQISESCCNFIRKLLEKDPEKRLGYNGVEEVKLHHWWCQNIEDSKKNKKTSTLSDCNDEKSQKLYWEIVKNREMDVPIIPVIRGKYDVSNFTNRQNKYTADSGTDYLEKIVIDAHDHHFEKFAYQKK